MNEVVRSAALLGVGHLAVAWNEEMVFRGYGFETVREALGQGKAVAVLIPGFGPVHMTGSSSLWMTPVQLSPLECDCRKEGSSLHRLDHRK